MAYSEVGGCHKEIYPGQFREMLSIQRKKFRIWIQAFRPFTYTASMTPCFGGRPRAVLRRRRLLVAAAFYCHCLLLHPTPARISSETITLSQRPLTVPHSFGGSRVLVDRLPSAPSGSSGRFSLCLCSPGPSACSSSGSGSWHPADWRGRP